MIGKNISSNKNTQFAYFYVAMNKKSLLNIALKNRV